MWDHQRVLNIDQGATGTSSVAGGVAALGSSSAAFSSSFLSPTAEDEIEKTLAAGASSSLSELPAIPSQPLNKICASVHFPGRGTASDENRLTGWAEPRT